jgi:catechol 2,3-dioxygenase-like lactoylglutathione lyase family enzyme
MPISALIPQLRTTDLKATIDFYVSKLGFELEFVHDDFYAAVKTGAHSIHVKLVDSEDPSIEFVAKGEHLHLYFTVEDVDAEARRLKGRGVALQAEPQDHPWGTREFVVIDDQGHTLRYGQRI